MSSASDRFFVAVTLYRGLIAEADLLPFLVESSNHSSLRERVRDRGLVSRDWLEEFEANLAERLATVPDPDRQRVTAELAERAALLIQTQLHDGRIRAWLAGEPDNERHNDGFRGAFELEQRQLLGKGGLGEVWLAVDACLRRELAVKRIRPTTKTPKMMARFLREAQIAGRLQHQNIVPIYQYAADPHEPFYVMRRIVGRTLTEEIREQHSRKAEEHSPNWRRLVTVMIKAADAIDFAHANGVIHRDLKPDNIMIGEYGEVTVIDWGLAKLIHEDADDGVSTEPKASAPLDQTAAGAVIGSPLYMAPEQASGDINRVSTQTDIYALGGILFQILAGRPPHEPLVATSLTLTEFFEKIAKAPVPPQIPKKAEAPPPLIAICNKAMASDPSQRYPDVGAFIAELNRWQAGEPVQAYREPFSQRLARWAVRNHRWTIGGVAVTLVAVIALTNLLTEFSADQRLFAEIEQTSARERANQVEKGIDLWLQIAAKDLQFFRSLLDPGPAGSTPAAPAANEPLSAANLQQFGTVVGKYIQLYDYYRSVVVLASEPEIARRVDARRNRETGAVTIGSARSPALETDRRLLERLRSNAESSTAHLAGSGVPAFWTAIDIRRDGRSIGCIAEEISYDSVLNELFRHHEARRSYYLLDGGGKPLWTSAEPSAPPLETLLAAGSLDIAGFMTNADAERHAMVRTSTRRTLMLFASKIPIGFSGAPQTVVFLEATDHTETTSQIQNERLYVAALLVGLLALLLVVAVFSARVIVHHAQGSRG